MKHRRRCDDAPEDYPIEDETTVPSSKFWLFYIAAIVVITVLVKIFYG